MSAPDDFSEAKTSTNQQLLAEAHLRCQEAAQALDRALNKPWHEVMMDSDEAERLAIQMRDRLIERLRQGDIKVEEAQGLRSVLDQINVSISLMVGIAYPSNGIRRPVIEQARDVLKAI